jgi:AcrR family transcriptional regulator
MALNNFSNEPDSKSRILESARTEILKNGIIGMRVSDVSKGADTSITLIYRYFVDRNGVLARVLGDMYDDFRLKFQTKVDEWLATNETITLEHFAYLMPNPVEETKHSRDFRLQVLATALENPELNERIKAVTTSTYRWMRDTIESARHKLPIEEQQFDARFLTVIMFNLMFVYYDLVDEDKISADEYRAMLVNQIRNSAKLASR